MLKKVLIGLGVIIAIVLIAAAIMPKEMTYEGSIQINAPQEQVWQFTSSLEGLDKWSPWNAKDPGMKQEFTGTSGEVGSKQCWDSENKEVGKGCQEISEIKEYEHLGTILTFERPRESEGTATVDLVAKDGGTEVTWGLKGPMPWPSNIFLLMMDMDEMMGPDWKAGLNSLKLISETAAAEAKDAAQRMEAAAAAEETEETEVEAD